MGVFPVRNLVPRNINRGADGQARMDTLRPIERAAEVLPLRPHSHVSGEYEDGQTSGPHGDAIREYLQLRWICRQAYALPLQLVMDARELGDQVGLVCAVRPSPTDILAGI